ncbi:MAG TPA: carboxypeptidase-like regulatory domain-containing protein [Cytophagales bacterium]|nr:carboxypeptidase-like regulatory domain-containing protein [Cytophagales bacterium]
MNFKNLLILLYFPVLIASSQDQNTIKGMVIDGKTGDPIEYVTVFIVGTTIGTYTNNEGRYELKNFSPGQAQLMFSHLGYESVKKTINITPGINFEFNITLNSTRFSLPEVEIVGKKDREWLRNYKKFSKVLLGRTEFAKHCEIKNGWVVKFSSEKKGKLVATADKPIEVENKSLGYKVFFYLKRFELEKNNVGLFLGDTRFEELIPKNSKEAEKWERNRRKAYLGSSHHFFKSLVNGTWKKEGFLVYGVQATTSPHRSSTFSEHIGTTFMEYGEKEVANFINSAGTNYEKNIILPHRIQIFYTKESPITLLYKDILWQGTLIKMLKKEIPVNIDGRIYDPLSFEMAGYWVDEGVADMFPYNYVPTDQLVEEEEIKSENIIIAKLDSFRLKNLYQTIKFHTDKDYYFAGETIKLKSVLFNDLLNRVYETPQVIYVDLISPYNKVVDHFTIRSENGKALGYVPLRNTLVSGTYKLRVYTLWMRNFSENEMATEVIPIIGLNQPKEILHSQNTNASPLNFYKIHGDLIEGEENTLLIKSSVPLEGEIWNNKDSIIFSLKTDSTGFGIIKIKPDSGTTYYAEITDSTGKNIHVKLPKASRQGIAMIPKFGEDFVDLTLSGKILNLNNCFILCHSKAKVFYQNEINISSANQIFRIPVPLITDPTFYVLVFGPGNNLLTEQKFINYNYEKRNVSFNVALEEQEKASDKISLLIEATEDTYEPLECTFSLLLSDLFYLKQKSLNKNIGFPIPMAYQRLLLQEDNYSWNKINAFLEKDDLYPEEKYLQIKGLVKSKLSGKPLKKGYITLWAQKEKLLISAKVNNEGKFEIPNESLKDGTKVIFYVRDANDQPIDAEITIERNSVPKMEFSEPQKFALNFSAENEEFLEKAKEKLFTSYSSSNSFFEEVSIEENLTISPQEIGKSVATYRIPEGERNSHILFFLKKKIPDLFEDQKNKKLLILKNSPLFFLEGIPINAPLIAGEQKESESSAGLTLIEDLFCNTVDRIEVVDNLSINEKSDLFANHKTGIFIYLKKGSPIMNSLKEKPKTYSLEGYQNLENSPYFSKNLGEIYWNIEVNTDVFGKSIISIQNDQHEFINTLINGLTEDGQSFRKETIVTINN